MTDKKKTTSSSEKEKPAPKSTRKAVKTPKSSPASAPAKANPAEGKPSKKPSVKKTSESKTPAGKPAAKKQTASSAAKAGARKPSAKKPAARSAAKPSTRRSAASTKKAALQSPSGQQPAASQPAASQAAAPNDPSFKKNIFMVIVGAIVLAVVLRLTLEGLMAALNPGASQMSTGVPVPVAVAPASSEAPASGSEMGAEGTAVFGTPAPGTADQGSQSPVIQTAPGIGSASRIAAGRAQDFDSSTALAAGTVIGGDRFTSNRFERPFEEVSAEAYRPQIDLVGFRVDQDAMWIYGSADLKDLKNAAGDEKYAMEIDAGGDGQGDYLIVAALPQSTDWSPSGVIAYADSNNDVGCSVPGATDPESCASDGFETALTLPEGFIAAARISPENPNTIEIALSRQIVPGQQRFMVSMWAGTALLDPALGYLNDRFTHAQAGAADASLVHYYGIKAVRMIDNTCRIAFGFVPSGDEPGLCDGFYTPKSRP